MLTLDIKGAFDAVLPGRLIKRLRTQGWLANRCPALGCQLHLKQLRGAPARPRTFSTFSHPSWAPPRFPGLANPLIPFLSPIYNIGSTPYIKPRRLECDNEIIRRREVKKWLEQVEHMVIEPSPPDTPALDGAAERWGGMVNDKLLW